jgi:streptomycin 6-kinase
VAAVDVPGPVRQKAEALGPEGAAWLSDLPDLVRRLERDWGVVAGSAMQGGTESYVTSATTHDGVEVVMKLCFPGDRTFDQKAQTLESARGRGYVRMLRHDRARGAMLLERLGPSLAVSGLSVEAQIEILCATLTQVWAAEPRPQLDSGIDKAQSLAAFISTTWEDLGHPCRVTVIERAFEFADARAAAFDPLTAVVVHGDAHSSNALRVQGSGTYKFVDPESFFAERAYDLGISMREWSADLLEGDALERGLDRCALLGRLAGVPTQPIWEWGYLERVSTGLLCLKVGYEAIGRQMLDVAELWSRSTGPESAGRLAHR